MWPRSSMYIVPRVCLRRLSCKRFGVGGKQGPCEALLFSPLNLAGLFDFVCAREFRTAIFRRHIVTNQPRIRSFVLSILFLFACAAAYAQQNSEITGTVVDNQGAAIPGAHVSITATATGFVSDTDTNAAGIYNFPK